MCKFATQKNKMDIFDYSPIIIFQVFATFYLGVKYAIGLLLNEGTKVVWWYYGLELDKDVASEGF